MRDPVKIPGLACCEGTVLKQKLKFFISMKFALILLLILVAACVAGSVIPQNQEMSWYTRTYSEQAAGAIMLFDLDDVFHAPWFVVLTVILCVNLLGCNVIRFPALVKRTRNGFRAEKLNSGHLVWMQEPAAEVKDPEAVFSSVGFRKIEKLALEDGTPCLYAVKNKAGIWGAWVCHLGMLVVILGFGLGQMYMKEYTVYGVPGQTKRVGDTPYELTIDTFETTLREDDTVEQYTSTLTMKDTATGETASGEVKVNAPLSLFGMRLYQNSTGWAADMQVSKDGEVIQTTTLCAGESALVEDMPELIMTLAAFYPDYVVGADGMPESRSGSLVNPGYLYRLQYLDQVLGMKVLGQEEVITVDAYEIRFVDPQMYSLIQLKIDPFTKIAALGGLLVIVGLLLAFYLRTAELAALQQADGSWKLFGYSKKGGAEFLETVRKAAEAR